MGRPQLRWEDNIRKVLVPAKYKRMEETRRGQGYVEANC
jgi:hypothetical protein